MNQLLPIVIFVLIFLLVVSGALMLFYSEEVIQRIRDVINPPVKEEKKALNERFRESGLKLKSIMLRFNDLMPKGKAEVSSTVQRLRRAGFREENASGIFFGAKVAAPLVGALLGAAVGVWRQQPILGLVAGLAVGYIAPDFWLNHRIGGRQKRMERGLADVLDLLVICIEAGLGMDQATDRTARELYKACPDICDELNVVVLEQRAGQVRTEAWRNLADRTGVESLRGVVTMMIQSDQLGTSIAKTMRVQADTLRQKRIAKVEEEAAKTTVKLIFPLVLCIFPALFVVVLGPAMIMLFETFAGLNH